MSQPATLEVQKFIDAYPLSNLQKVVIGLCFLVVAIDGFDTAAVGFIAPALLEQWHLTKPQLAPLFGAGLFGLMAGALVFGPLADKVGRKPILIGSVLVFGLASLLSAFSPDLQSLTILRFITGIGLGGAMPNAITLTSEYCPTPRRASLVTLMFCGFTVGSALGGIASAALIGTIGWQGILMIGGVLPLLLLPVLVLMLPESLRFLVLKNKAKATIEAIAKRLVTTTAKALPTLTAATNEKSRVSVRELFSPRYALGTILMWLAFFMSLFIIYFISSWIPTWLKGLGYDLKTASWITSVFQIGGTIGAIALGVMMDKIGASKVLYLSYFAGAICLFLFGYGVGQQSMALLLIGMFGVGVGISGSQVGANAFCSSFYPTNCRATGVSWANAAGRSGSVIGSMIGGWLMSLKLTPIAFTGFLAIPAVLAAIMFVLIANMMKRHQELAVDMNVA